METIKHTFLLGVGAKAAGSYPLANALSKCTSCEFGFAKEYDILQAMFLPRASERREQILRTFEREVFEPFGKWQGSPNSMRMSFLINTSAYFDYFMWLLSNTSARLTGDFSQSYLRLPPWVFNRIKEEFGIRGIVTVPVFVVRNPVYLLRSLAVNRLVLRKELATHQSLVGEMSRILNNPWDKKLFDFIGVAQKLRSCFKDQSCFLLYEEIIENHTASQLEQKLGFQVEDFSAHAGRLVVKDDAPQLGFDEYNFFEEKFGSVVASFNKEFPEFDIERHWRYLK